MNGQTVSSVERFFTGSWGSNGTSSPAPTAPTAISLEAPTSSTAPSNATLALKLRLIPSLC